MGRSQIFRDRNSTEIQRHYVTKTTRVGFHSGRKAGKTCWNPWEVVPIMAQAMPMPRLGRATIVELR